MRMLFLEAKIQTSKASYEEEYINFSCFQKDLF